MKLRYYLFFLFSVFCFLSSASYADVVYMKDGKEMKGIVIEDYKDRVVLSTINGEVTVKKEEIKELYFDSEEDNLIKLAEQAKDRRDFARAFTYYNMALKKDPDSKPANDGLVFLQGYLFRKEESEKLDDIKKRENLERYGTVAVAEKSKTGEEAAKEMAAKLKETIGLTLELGSVFPKVTDVRPKSPAYASGMRKGDSIVALWGKLTGYKLLPEMMDAMLEKSSLEIKCTIERTVDIEPEGASFTMEFNGLTVSGVKELSGASAGGLKKDDLIVAIDGKSTRYMPLNKAVALINKTKSGTANLTLRREILIWRGE